MNLIGANQRSQMSTGRGKAILDDEDMQLPFEELDSCCQKEIVNENHHARVGAELRKHDRTLERMEMHKKAINSLRKGFCVCGTDCEMIASDYPLLAMIRGHAGNERVIGSDLVAAGMDGERRGDGESESDDDSLLDDMGDEFLTTEEKIRLEEVVNMQKLVEKARGMGYAQHMEETASHCGLLIKSQQTLILHIYNPNSLFCARLDLELEKLAVIYIGTKFRRMPMSTDTSYFVESQVEKGISVSAQSAQPRVERGRPFLVAFKDGAVCFTEGGLSRFGSDREVYQSELVTYFSNAHVLSSEVVMPSLQQLAGFNAEEEPEDDPESSSCGFPGCKRSYNHSHVAAGADSLVKGDDEEGMEALAQNVFTRM
jgi:hypothetical protein